MHPEYEVPSSLDEPVNTRVSSALSSIKIGMKVVDRSNHALGEVRRIFTPVTVDEMDSMVWQGYVQVGNRGPLGLAKDIWIPSNFVAGVRGERLVIDVDKNQIPDLVWDRPYSLPETED